MQKNKIKNWIQKLALTGFFMSATFGFWSANLSTSGITTTPIALAGAPVISLATLNGIAYTPDMVLTTTTSPETVTLAFNTNETAQCAADLDPDTSDGQIDPGFVLTHTFQGSLFQGQSYTVYVSCTSESTSETTTGSGTFSIIADTTPPVITHASFKNHYAGGGSYDEYFSPAEIILQSGENELRMNVSTNEETYCTGSFTGTLVNGSTNIGDYQVYDINHNQSLGLIAIGDHASVDIICTDRSGNESATTTMSFTIADIIEPTITLAKFTSAGVDYVSSPATITGPISPEITINIVLTVVTDEPTLCRGNVSANGLAPVQYMFSDGVTPALSNTLSFVGWSAGDYATTVITCTDESDNNSTERTMIFTISDPGLIAGACGNNAVNSPYASGATVPADWSTGYCSTGTASAEPAFPAAGATVSWTCLSSGGDEDASCSASRTAAPAGSNGVCGSANGVAVLTEPTLNLCSVGTQTSPAGNGPWTWSCVGSNGGTTASCSAPLADVQQVATPIPSQPAGSYAFARSIALYSATAGANIYYTTNGTTPTSSSTLYTSAIYVSTNKTIKAIAIKTGMTNSNIMSASYVIDPDGDTDAVDEDDDSDSNGNNVGANSGDGHDGYTKYHKKYIFYRGIYRNEISKGIYLDVKAVKRSNPKLFAQWKAIFLAHKHDSKEELSKLDVKTNTIFWKYKNYNGYRNYKIYKIKNDDTNKPQI